MYLKSLELQGFKSFPDKIELKFNKGITAVVGPNGSGKSNIGDAMRWVMGEQSSKALRGEKMAGVIFHGTQTRPKAPFAQVTITIDNEDGALEYDSDTVSVSRKLYRNGDSFYMINGKEVNLKDIVELFMDTGLGRDGYSIIGQGRIADIVNGKSNDRREIFEEAAGISKFRSKKKEAEKKLAAAEDNLSRINDIMGDNKFMEDNELLEHFQAVPMDNIKSAEQAGMLIGESNGMYYVETGTYNTMIVGAPRSGKGECYVLPSMRLMANSKNKPSLIINDMKGELLELTYEDFANNGYKIVTLNLIDTDRSDCWNPLQLIIDEYLAAKRSGSNDLSQTSKLVSSFAHCLTDDVQSEAIWTDSARSLLSALIYYFLDKGYEKGDMSNVNMYSITTFFTEFGVYNTVIEDESGNKKMVNALDELFNALPVGCLARTSYSTSKFSQGDTRSSIYTVLSADLEIFMTDMGVQKLTSKNEINFADLINEDQPCIIYMLVPYEEKSRYVIASMFADQSFMYLAKQARKYQGGKLPRKIEYIYDEFGQMTKLPDLSSKMNASPGANILFNLFLQDYGQLKKYDKEEDGIK